MVLLYGNWKTDKREKVRKKLDLHLKEIKKEKKIDAET
jgi:hypothetical protein